MYISIIYVTPPCNLLHFTIPVSLPMASDQTDKRILKYKSARTDSRLLPVSHSCPLLLNPLDQSTLSHSTTPLRAHGPINSPKYMTHPMRQLAIHNSHDSIPPNSEFSTLNSEFLSICCPFATSL